MTIKDNNVDPEEIEKFSAFAEDWWNENGSMKPLHQLNPLRLKYIDVHSNIANKKILDVGCGGGILSESMARACADVTGIDMSEAAINIAKQNANRANIQKAPNVTVDAYNEKQYRNPSVQLLSI